jgi:hypothetical protein
MNLAAEIVFALDDVNDIQQKTDFVDHWLKSLYNRSIDINFK